MDKIVNILNEQYYLTISTVWKKETYWNVMGNFDFLLIKYDMDQIKSKSSH